MGWADFVRDAMFSLPGLRYFYPRPAAAPSMVPTAMTEMSIPRANEGIPIPLAYGTNRLKAPILVRIGDFKANEITLGGALIGFSYFVAMRFVLCRGNSDLSATTGGASFVAMYVGDRKVDTVHGPGEVPTDSASCESYSLSDSRLYDETPNGDGEPVTGPDVLGIMYFYRGRWDQAIHPRDITATENIAYVPPRRGKVCVSLSGSDTVSDPPDTWQIGPSANLQPYSWVVHNPVTIPGYESTTGALNNGDANPAAVLYDLLTTEWGGLGIPTASIDVASFTAAAQVFADEGMGISIKFENNVTGRDAVELVLRHVDAVMYEDLATRSLVLAPIREDYDAGLIPVIDESVVVGTPEVFASLWDETINEVVVSYIDAAKDWTQATETAQDAANMNIQGRRNRADRDFPGCSNATLAATLASRELNFLSRPIMKLQVKVKRSMQALRPGDPFRFQWASYGAAGLDGVFRVGEIDFGTLEDGTITISAAQDRFAIPGPLFGDPDAVGDVPQYATPVSLREITEAPRWVQVAAFNAGTIANVDAQRGYYLAAPAGSDSRYRVDTDDASDAPPRVFPGRFTVSTAYARSTGPYDTSTGLVIDDVAGWTPAAASATAIATTGANLIQIGGEILAFESVTGTGPYTLHNVWRGVLDTVPADHDVGAQGYVLPGVGGVGALGSRTLTHGASYTMRTLAAAGSDWTPAAESPTDAVTARSRVRLPYPVDALTVNGSQAPAALEDDGVAMTFATRDRLQASITRPDASAETPEAGTTYNAVAYKGDGPQEGGVQIVLASGVSTGSTVYPLGKAGHGLLEVGVDSALVVDLPDGSSPTLGAWQVPTLAVSAPHHRNLVINGRFASSANWTTVTGSGSFGSGSGSLGGGGTMATPAGSVTTLTIRQDVPVSGYPPGNLRGLLELAAGPTTGDANDTIAVSMVERDSGGTTLATHSIAATHPTAWDRYQVDVASLDPDLDTVRVDLTAATASVGDGGDTHADIGVTEVELRIGQFTDQLLANPEFASGLTSWTQSVGTWQVLTATLYGSPAYVRPNDGASATMYQDVTPPTGYARNATAVVWCGRMNDAASDTGKVTIQALDAGAPPAVLASAATGDEAMATTNVWSRRYLTLDLPADTASVRVKFEATRVSGTPLNACFSDPRLRIFKALDPSVDATITTNAPPTMRIPATRAEWVAAYPSITPPNVAMYAGREIGELGIEPLLESVGSASFNGEFLCDEGRQDGRRRTACMDLYGGTVRVAPVGNSFMNFRSTEDWCVAVVYKSGVWQGSEAGLVARSDASTVGWELYLDAGGVLTANVFGAGGAAQVTDATSPPIPAFGEMRVAILHYAHATHILSLITERGLVGADDVSAAGEFRTPDPGQPSGGISANSSAMNGQIARIWAWRGSTTPSASTLSAVPLAWTADPVAGLVELTPRVGSIISIDGDDGAGLMARTWPVGVAPYVLDDEIGDLAAFSSPACTNLAAWDLSLWSTVSGTVAVAACPVTAIREGRSIISASGGGLRSPTIAFGSAATIHFRVCYAAPDGAATFVLEDNSGSTVASYTLPTAATATIEEFSLSWSGATSGNGKIRITSGDVARTLTISPAMYAGTGIPAHRTIPCEGTGGAVMPSVTIAPSTLWNHEGELQVDQVSNDAITSYTIARAWNGTNGNDNRQIRSASGSLEGKHGNSAAGNTTASVALTLDTAVRYTARLRWTRCGLVDGTASEFTSIRGEQGATVDTATGRTAAWTPSATEVTRLDLGHDNGSDVGVVRFAGIRIMAREPRL